MLSLFSCCGWRRALGHRDTLRSTTTLSVWHTSSPRSPLTPACSDTLTSQRRTRRASAGESAPTMVRPNKKKPEIPITLPTLNYPATLFHIFIFMQIYAYFYLIMLIYAIFFVIMQIYEDFMPIFMKFFEKAKKP